MTRHERIQTTEVPAWAIRPDLIADMTDAYNEVTDPENEWGEECLAVFRYEPEEVEPRDPYMRAWFEDFPHLTGIIINDSHGPSYVERENAIRMLGRDVIERVEEANK